MRMGGVAHISWQADLLRHARDASSTDPRWHDRLADPTRGIHLAVMVEPYLSMLLLGLKTVESRFTATRRAPWNCVRAGDLLLLKKSSGPITGLAEVGRVWSYEIGGQKTLASIRSEFDSRVRGEPKFWTACAHARYATLMQIARVAPVKPLNCHKRDQRGWVVLRPGA
jgi:hypothetical protein